jgi:hypothetical protein
MDNGVSGPSGNGVPTPTATSKGKGEPPLADRSPGSGSLGRPSAVPRLEQE